MTWVEVALTFSAALFVSGLVGGHTRLGRQLLWSSAAVLVVLLLSFGREIVFDVLLGATLH